MKPRTKGSTHKSDIFVSFGAGGERKKERKKAAVQITGYVTDLVFNNSQYLISTECCQNSIA